MSKQGSMTDLSEKTLGLLIEISGNMQQRLQQSSERDLRKAAEAVVDAAIWRHRLRAETLGAAPEVPEPTRLALIEMIFKDPSQTAFLFQDEAWERH